MLVYTNIRNISVGPSVMSRSTSTFNRSIIDSHDVFFGENTQEPIPSVASKTTAGGASAGRYLDSDNNPIRPPTPRLYESFEIEDENFSTFDEMSLSDSERERCAREIDRQSKQLFRENVLLKMMDGAVPMSSQLHGQTEIDSSVPVYSVQHDGGTKIKIKIERVLKKATRKNKENVPAEPSSDAEPAQEQKLIQQQQQQQQQQQPSDDSDAMFQRSNTMRKVNYMIERQLRPPPQTVADNTYATTTAATCSASSTTAVASAAISKRRVAHRSKELILASRPALKATNLPHSDQTGGSSSNASTNSSFGQKSTSKPSSKRGSSLKKIAKCLSQTVARYRNNLGEYCVERPAKSTADSETPPSSQSCQESFGLLVKPISSSFHQGPPASTRTDNNLKTNYKNQPKLQLAAVKSVVCQVNAANYLPHLPPKASKKRKASINAASSVAAEELEPPQVKTAKQQLLQRLHGNSLYQLGVQHQL